MKSHLYKSPKGRLKLHCLNEKIWPPGEAFVKEPVEILRKQGKIPEERFQKYLTWNSRCGKTKMDDSCHICDLCQIDARVKIRSTGRLPWRRLGYQEAMKMHSSIILFPQLPEEPLPVNTVTKEAVPEVVVPDVTVIQTKVIPKRVKRTQEMVIETVIADSLPDGNTPVEVTTTSDVEEASSESSVDSITSDIASILDGLEEA